MVNEAFSGEVQYVIHKEDSFLTDCSPMNFQHRRIPCIA